MPSIKLVEIEQKPFKCPQCRQRFKTKKNIPRHMKLKHSKGKPIHCQCILCKTVYQNKGNHDAHYRKSHLSEYLMYQQPEVVNVKGNLLFQSWAKPQNLIATSYRSLKCSSL